jgi:hypothetical protein
MYPSTTTLFAENQRQHLRGWRNASTALLGWQYPARNAFNAGRVTLRPYAMRGASWAAAEGRRPGVRPA